MAERRFTDEESAAIFRVAAEGPPDSSAQSSRLDGLTLTELQAIGQEVGLSAEALARAAQVLEVRRSAVSRRLLGLPIGVERRVKLDRRLTDEEWEHLVVRLREVFQARGAVRSEGTLRQWTNGNLYVLLEPTPEGHRLRLGSLYGGAAASIRLGLTGLAAAAALGIASLMGADVGTAVPTLLAGGLALVANGALRVPRWARLRGRQMEDLAAQLAPVPGAPPPSLPGGSAAPSD